MKRASAGDGSAIGPAAVATGPVTAPPRRHEAPPDASRNVTGTASVADDAPPGSGTISATSAPRAKPRPAGAGPWWTKTQDLPPAILDRYEILSELGSGGMGAVFRARDRRLGRDVALKLLLRRDPDSALRMVREARAQARLDHENVCRVFEAGDADGACHIAMQLIDGQPLSVAGERMTIEQKVRVTAQVARALHHAHRRGLVHRDVKPSNVMIEQGEDGGCKPYLVDFGIAREVGALGQTATGAIAGTFRFMAPEQARGEIRALDRRTDVYGLGATLFDVLAGRPPFTAPNEWRLLQEIVNADAPPIRTLRPEIPRDLEAIVARCLEKAPERRYESARALAEDLDRFLDGDPVRARRLSPGYVLSRAVRKHRTAVALAAAALLAALFVVALWIREQRLAAARADLSRELGEDVKEMELFLRSAFELPLHDIEQEKDLVRARLRGVEARMAAMGRAGEGPGHYALGRGYLALQEPEEARAHLVKASAAGYSGPDLDYALGLALGELATKATEETKRIDDPARRQARREAIKAQYEEPALRHLRASLGARLEAPAYVYGLIALHAGRPEEALERAREASTGRPWLYEARKLEGDARFALGSRFRADAAFDHDRMTAEFQAAAEAYASAAEVARSDPRVHEAECELWAQVMNAAPLGSDPLRPSYERARAACRRAIAASSRGDRAHLKLAFLQVAFSWSITVGAVSEDSEAVLAEAISLAEEAMRRSPDDPLAPYVMAEARRTEARRLSDRGLDARPPLARAIASYEEALRLDPTFLWAVNDLAYAHTFAAQMEISRGEDPRASLDKALSLGRRARELDPGFLNAYAHESIAYLVMAEHLVDEGRDPAPALAPWRSTVEAGSALSHDWPWASYYRAYQLWLEARRELDAGRDPGALLDEAAQVGGDGLRRAAPASAPGMLAGKLALTRAVHLLGQGQDPGPVLGEARETFQRGVEAAPGDLGFRILRARVEVVALRWAAREHRLRASSFPAARAPLIPMLDRERVDPDLYQTLAEIAEIEAAWLHGAGKSAEEPLAAGLSMAAKALALNPHLARASATEGALLLLRAGASRAPGPTGPSK